MMFLFPGIPDQFPGKREGQKSQISREFPSREFPGGNSSSNHTSFNPCTPMFTLVSLVCWFQVQPAGGCCRYSHAQELEETGQAGDQQEHLSQWRLPKPPWLCAVGDTWISRVKNLILSFRGCHIFGQILVAYSVRIKVAYDSNPFELGKRIQEFLTQQAALL